MTTATKLKTTDLPLERIRLADIEAASYNPRSISADAYKGLRESIGEFGLLEMPVVNKKDGALRLVSGHQRVAGMIEDGIEYADCLVVELDATAERVANLTMNNPAIRGTYDPVEALRNMPNLKTDIPRPDFAGFDKMADHLREWSGRLTTMRGKSAKDEGEEDTVSTSTVKSKVGMVYKLGDHRVYCGDFSKGLPKMLGKRKAAACVTDPPYNVDYESRDGDTIENDKLGPEAFQAFLAQMSKALLKHCKGPTYSFMSSKELHTFQRAWEKAGGSVERWLYWCKERFVLGLADYRSQHEPIMVGIKSGDDVDCGATLTTVIESPRAFTNPLHPTQKTTALMQLLLEDCTEQGDLVIDPFAGSGTTLVVAEEIGRTCYACELQPHYVDVIRQRYTTQVHGSSKGWAKKTPVMP